MLVKDDEIPATSIEHCSSLTNREPCAVECEVDSAVALLWYCQTSLRLCASSTMRVVYILVRYVYVRLFYGAANGESHSCYLRNKQISLFVLHCLVEPSNPTTS